MYSTKNLARRQSLVVTTKSKKITVEDDLYVNSLELAIMYMYVNISYCILYIYIYINENAEPNISEIFVTFLLHLSTHGYKVAAVVHAVI